jgi:hypothetical protein
VLLAANGRSVSGPPPGVPGQPFSVADLEGGGVLWLRTPPIVEPGCADVRVAEPLLDLRNVAGA